MNSPLEAIHLLRLLYFSGESSCAKQTFCSIDGKEVEERRFYPLRGGSNSIRGSFHGSWLLLFRNHRYSLWNPTTDLPPIGLPTIIQKGEDGFYHPVLCDAGTDRFFLVFQWGSSRCCILFCRVGDQRWRRQWVDKRICEEIIRDNPIWSLQPVTCNDKIYIQGRSKLLVAQAEPTVTRILKISPLLDIPEPATKVCCSSTIRGSLECCGELFYVIVTRGAGCIGPFEYIDVELYRLNLSQKEWIEVKNIPGGHAFFIGTPCFSLPVLPTTDQIKPNHIYIQVGPRVYSFNLQDNRLCYMPIPLPNSSSTKLIINPIWLVPDLRQVAKHRLLSTEIINSTTIGVVDDIETAKQLVSETTHDLITNLPMNLLQHEIISRLTLHDQINLRAANTLFRSILPHPMTDSLKEKRVSLAHQPWLAFSTRTSDACAFIDPATSTTKKYFMRPHDHQASPLRLRYARESWCVVLQGEHSISLWNPFTKGEITLPDCPHKCIKIMACGLSDSPDKPNSLLVLLVDGFHLKLYMDILIIDERRWLSEFAFDRPNHFDPCYCTTFTALNKQLYCLDEVGRMLVFRQNDYTWEVLEDPILPADKWHTRSYLVECQGELLLAISAPSPNP